MLEKKIEIRKFLFCCDSTERPTCFCFDCLFSSYHGTLLKKTSLASMKEKGEENETGRKQNISS